MPVFPHQRPICLQIPPKVNSEGIWENLKSPTTILTYSLPLFQLQILLIFFFTQAIHVPLKRFRLPIFVSQLLAGIILGPSIIGISAKYSEIVFPIASQEILGAVGTLGYTMFMFLSGVKMDVAMIYKTGFKAFLIGILSLAAPIALGFTVQGALEKSTLTKDVPEKLPLITTVLSITPFPVISALLADLKFLNSELGRVGLSAAMMGDAGSVLLANAATLIEVGRHNSVLTAFRYLACTIGYTILVMVGVRPVMFWVVKQTPKGKPVRDFYINAIFLMVLGSGILTNTFGQSIFLGPFILGLAVPDGPPLGSALVDRMDVLVSHIFLPLFVTISAMKADFALINSNKNLLAIDSILILVTLTAKIGACFLAALACRMPLLDSFAIALIMSCKGVVELGTYSFMRDSNNITGETFTVLFTSVLITASIVPIVVRYIHDPSRKYAGYQKRNITHLKPNSELRILLCIHNPNNITAAINLLDASCPTSERPIAAYVLHLIKLVGRASPVFISHNLQIKKGASLSYSENVILLFNQYQQNYMGSVSVNTFTAISPPKSMHEDICTLALDKLASLIVLPFHRTWSVDGSILSEDNCIRDLNCSVLERAPCSVGILVDLSCCRHQKPVQPLRNVLMIFFGGQDDREALSFAKRITLDSRISLTTIRFVAAEDNLTTTWEQMLDSEALKEVKPNKASNSDTHVTYIQEVVKNGPETAYILTEVANDYDLIILGRRNGVDCAQTTGLSQWNEFPELGVIGDLLVSSEFNCTTSVLVVQQQQKLK